MSQLLLFLAVVAALGSALTALQVWLIFSALRGAESHQRAEILAALEQLPVTLMFPPLVRLVRRWKP